MLYNKDLYEFRNERGRWEKTLLGEPLTIEIEMDEIRGQGRPRVGRFNRVYELPEDKRQKRIIAAAWIEKYGGPQYFNQADEIEIEVTVKHRLPPSAAKWREGESDTYKPDGDNILKSVQDALQNVAWAGIDDSAVTRALVVKDRRRTRAKDVLVVKIYYFKNIFIR